METLRRTTMVHAGFLAVKAASRSAGRRPIFVTSLITALLASGSMLAAAQQPPPLIFNETAPSNDLQGTLAARVQFAQSQILPARAHPGDAQPTLIGLRKTLVLVKPLQPDASTPMTVTARNRAGNVLGSLPLEPPALLPKTAYYVDGLPEGEVVFEPGSGPIDTISSQAELNNLMDPSGVFLLARLQSNVLVEIQTADGQWVPDMHLPTAAGLEGKIVRTRSNATFASRVHYSGRSRVLSRDRTLRFKFVGGQWILEEEIENGRITYAEGTWSGVLPAEWIAPGLALDFRQGALRGELRALEIGAPTEVLIHTIDVGMLTSPRAQFAFAVDPLAHREYFQTVPTSRMIVSQYAPVWLGEVMLPNGTLLTDHDPSEGGWHTGTMRQRIGKELISLGINNANYGIHSTPGEGESSHPYVAAQVTAHNSRGNYANGVVVHGGSGGAGMVTLDASLGNEFSHELGHNFALGHYVGGFDGSVHRGADQINSTWGWDGDANRFIANFSPTRSDETACLDGRCQPPFHGRTFGFDAMAGGYPFSDFNRFTLYTPNSAAIIQSFLETRAVFDAGSPTGFRKWNAATATMEPYTHTVDTDEVTAPVGDLSEATLAALLAEHGAVKVAMWDGNWNPEIHVPPASLANLDDVLTIDHDATFQSRLFINGQQITVSNGFEKSYTSNGSRWNEAPLNRERKPQAFGVPVTTLVGYYDPQGLLPSYAYPALHGAYGFAYGDDDGRLRDEDCRLHVETEDGQLRFRLANRRLGGNVMNKFHVNVPAASKPSGASVVCGGQVLVQRDVRPPAETLSFTVNGRPLSDRCDHDLDGDGTPDCLDPCTNVGGRQNFARRVNLTLSNVGVDLQTGNDALMLSGSFNLSPAVSFGNLDPSLRGGRVVVRNAAGVAVIDASLPPGLYAGRGTRGWKVDARGSAWHYLDRTGSPLAGIIDVKAKDRSRGVAGGSVKVSIKGKAGTYAVSLGDTPVQAILVLGDSNDGFSGACGETGYTADQCWFNKSNKRLVCRR